MNDRQLIDRQLAWLTGAGWQIVSQSDSAFQAVYPHVVSGAMAAIFVVGPLGLGILVSLFSVPFGSILFWIAVIMAALFVLVHLSSRPKLIYITAEQLRTPAQIEHTPQGLAVCSHCTQPASPKRPACLTCGAQFASA